VTETQTVMCINSGSSSLKFHVYEMGAGAAGGPRPAGGIVTGGGAAPGGSPHSWGLSEELMARGAVEGIGQGEGRLWFVDGRGEPFAERDLHDLRHEHAIEQALAMLSLRDLPSIEAIGHRVVHGGPNHFAPEILTRALIEDLRGHTAWAPLHMPASLCVIEALEVQRPGLPQVACFDTAFHASMPEIARRLPLPRRFFDQGIHKYGFHGLSYEYVLGVLGGQAGGRVVIAHLGNGASMAACLDGRPMETTMGMTPLGGFMMGTRTGDMDPGVPLYLVREQGYDDKSLEHLLDKESGLKGVSGETADMKALLELRSHGHEAAAEAVEMYCYQARKTVGSLAAVLGGLDLLVFTGGMGEKAAPVRALICKGLGFLGIELDAAANEAHAETISAPNGSCTVKVVPTNEDVMIARHTYSLVFGGAANAGADPSEGGRS
jgi:acetate kinase